MDWPSVMIMAVRAALIQCASYSMAVTCD
jgi:hypothetical protein